MKKKLLIMVMVLSVIIGVSYLKADSGWDMDYDYGGSSWSSSSYDYDYDYDYGSSSYYVDGSGGSEGWPVLIITVLFILYACITDGKKSSSSSSTYNTKRKFEDISLEEASKYGINIKEFKINAFNKYVNIQNAWSEFDYDKLQTLLTDELFNTYKMQLDTLKIKHQKNIMKDFKYIDAKVYNVKNEGTITTVSLYLNISMYDYVVDHKGNVVRGNDRRKVNIEYLIELNKDTGTSIKKCPNCGAEINAVVSCECEYCRSKIIVKPSEYVFASKSNVGQRWE